MRTLFAVVATFAIALPATAQEGGVRVSAGYAFSQYLEQGGGNAPLGAYLSLSSKGRRVGLEGDVAYHRDSEDFFGASVTLNTVTAAIGPRLSLRGDRSRPYLHLLAGARHDRVFGESNTAFGGMAGGGVDIPAGSAFFRLGADFQIFFDEGESAKTLRVTAGITF